MADLTRRDRRAVSWCCRQPRYRKVGLRRFALFRDSKRDLRAQQWFRWYGAALPLASLWIPFAGDFVSLIASLKDYDPLRFTIAIMVAKLLKSAAIVYSFHLFSSCLAYIFELLKTAAELVCRLTLAAYGISIGRVDPSV